MSEIYWITRLDSIHQCTETFIILSIILFIATFIACLIGTYYATASDWERDIKEAQGWVKTCKPIRNGSIIIFIVFSIIALFLPTSKEAMMIWGVGSTIDYIKTNDKIQQLPDKCVDALDAWVESLNEEKK